MSTVRRHVSGALLHWMRLSLADRYLLAGAGAMVLICVLAGLLVNTLLVRHELEERGNETALFLEGVFSPLLQGLSERGRMSNEDRGRVNALMGNADFTRRFPYLEIWLPSGEVAYSNSELISGRHFSLPQEARDAFGGQVGIAFSDLAAEEHVLRGLEAGLLEVYVPIHRLGGEEIIAVVEIHESAETLDQSLQRASFIGWLAVSVSGFLAFLILFGFVLKASRTITEQRRLLAERLKSSLHLVARFGEVEQAARQAAMKAERLAETRLKLASADLHDGPSQLISFALLKARETRKAKGDSARERAVEALETALVTALSEIRSIGQGLALPALAELGADAVIGLAVEAHERRTGMKVEREGWLGDAALGFEHKICLFRLVQEGLNNALRHSGSNKAKIVSRRFPDVIEIEIINPLAPAIEMTPHEGSGMGIEGLRMRVEVLGGSFSVQAADKYFSVKARFELEAA